MKGSRKVVQVGFSVATHFEYDDMFSEETSPLDANLILGMLPRHMPAIKSAILMEVMEFSEDQLNTRQGKQDLSESIRMAINSVLEKHEKVTTDPITDVMITSFVMQ